MHLITPLLSFALLVCSSNPYVSAASIHIRYGISSTTSSTVDSASIQPTLSSRANFPLGQCGNLIFSGSELSATCEVQREDAGPPDSLQTSFQLSKCIANEDGNLVFQNNGNAFQSCKDCNLSDLHLSCTCTGSQSNEVETSISLAATIDTTSGATGAGVFVTSSGQLSCVADGFGI
ncbi:hypothetical protein EK21DRAFT_95464 [Setomelanomma holmii]|uniref:Cyanovirin-N domain-containing protein n=1 Tax=Setomelanomma holmii TaxID=210430 RepID=A0A9P4GTP6_9PLEO|nr:hypothetical protein EK21DRAFT_95464 [Setomelanomma holmii]